MKKTQMFSSGKEWAVPYGTAKAKRTLRKRGTKGGGPQSYRRASPRRPDERDETAN